MTACAQPARDAANQLFNGDAVTKQQYLGPSLEGLSVFTLKYPSPVILPVQYYLYILKNGTIPRIRQ
jgi:hypothetical protein